MTKLISERQPMKQPVRKLVFISSDNHKKVRSEAYKKNKSMSQVLNEIIALHFKPVDK